MNELTQLKEQLSQGTITEAEYRTKQAALLTQCAAAAQKPAKQATTADPVAVEEPVAEPVVESAEVAVEETPAVEVVAEVVTAEEPIAESETVVEEATPTQAEEPAVLSGPQAGWYPDPSGTPNKLRYWNGTAWTDDYTSLEPQPEAAQPAASAQPAQEAQSAGAPQSPAAETPAVAPLPVPVPVPQQQNQQNAGGPQQPQDATSGSSIPPTSGTTYTAPTVDAPYKPSGNEETMRLVAFIFSLISTIGTAIFLIPLAWCIPMTVHCWKIYKGTKPNTTAFGVCTLLFVNMISGILLLISQKDQ